MLQSLRFTYSGPTEFITTDLDPKPIRLTLSCPEGLPVAAEARAIIEGFRAFTDGGWELEGVDVIGGKGHVVMGHDLPRHFRELVWPGVSPGGGQLLGGDHHRIQMCTVIVTRALDAGSDLVFSFKAVGARHARIYPTLELLARLQGDPSFTRIGDPIALPNHPGDPERLELRSKPIRDADGRMHGVLFAADPFGNPVPSYNGQLTFSEPVEATDHTPGSYAITGPENTGSAVTRIEVHDTQTDLKTIGTPVLSEPTATGNHYFGAIHFHTQYSVDGDGRLEDAYAYVRDHLNLDVVAATDHAPLGYQWEETLRFNDQFYDPHRFVTIPAWESSNAFGHANVYLRTPDTNADPGLWVPSRNPSEIIWPDDAIVIPHHPNAGEDPFARKDYQKALSDGIYWTTYDWSIPNPRVRLVEIVQGRGDFEADTVDPVWGIHQGGRGASVQDAFRMGFRLGFVAGSDNHQAYPTQMSGTYYGMTCFLAPELTRDAIWNAMNTRRTYATSGIQIVCDYSVNGLPLGSEGTIRAGDNVYFSAALHGSAPIERVDIISNGDIVWHSEPDAWDVALNEEVLPISTDTSAYYYLRLRQADGHRAWLSPVWLDMVSE